MYLEYFGFREEPFSIAPDPRYLYLSPRHEEALAHLAFGLKNPGGGFVLLTGEVGTGKTTLCRCALETVHENCDIAFIYNPKLSIPELLSAICDELGIPYPPGSYGTKVLVDVLNQRLLESHRQGRKTVLIIDEAQNLEVDVLEQLRLLTNLETNERKLLQIILIGQPELLDRLAQPGLRQLNQRILSRYHLTHLKVGELPAYVQHRLLVAGVRRRLFPEPVLRRLYRRTGGIPRLVNAVCDRALLGAYVRGADKVDGAILEQAAREVMGIPGRNWRNWLEWRLPALGIALTLGIAIVATQVVSTSGTREAAGKILSSSGER